MNGTSSDDELHNLVFENDDLTWNVVSQIIGAEDPSYFTRGASSSRASKVDKGKGIPGSSTQPTQEASGFNCEEMEDDIGDDDFGFDDELEYNDHDDHDSDY